MIKIENNKLTHNGRVYTFEDDIELFALLFSFRDMNRSDVLQSLIKKIAPHDIYPIRDYLKKRGWSSKRSIYNAAERGELTLEQIDGFTFVREVK